MTDNSLDNEGPGDSEFKVSALEVLLGESQAERGEDIDDSKLPGRGNSVYNDLMLVLEKSLSCLYNLELWLLPGVSFHPLGILFFLTEITLWCLILHLSWKSQIS